MIQVGLTGNIASGKSVVADAWSEAGIPVLKADDLAREAVGSGSPALDPIRERFGVEVFDERGSLDRARLRRIVFRDAEARDALERIVHPHVRTLRDRWIRERRVEGASLVAVEIPLLFELGLEDAFDVVVVVDAPEELREARLVEHRGLAPEEARRIMASQGDPAEKRRRADYVLRNAGTLEDLRKAASDLLDRLRSIPQPAHDS